MSKFIKLTDIMGKVFYQNLHFIDCFTEHEGITYLRCTPIENISIIKIKETPEEILALIEGGNYSPCRHEIRAEHLFDLK